MGNCCCQTENVEEHRPLLNDNTGTRQYSEAREDNHISGDQSNGNATTKFNSEVGDGDQGTRENSTEIQQDPKEQIEIKTQDLEKKLKYIYNKILLSNVSWLNKGEDLPIKDYFVPFQLTSVGFKVIVQDLFRANSKRIILQGPQGHGKSTLCYKILSDWASVAPYMDKFKLVFIIPIRNLKEIDAKDLIEAIAIIYSVDNPDDLRLVIENNIEDTLFIFDGLDELPEDVESIKPMSYINDKATILVTCRSGFKYSANSIVYVLDEKYYEKHFEINGIGEEKQKEFLDKYFPANVADVVERSLKNDPILNTMNELFNCPLFLALLGSLVAENEDPKFVSKTDLFKQLVNSAIKLSVKSENVEFDIFAETNVTTSGFTEFISGFSKLLITGKPSGETVFGSNKFTKEIHKLGLMTRHNEIYTLTDRTYYEIFHESLLEFLVAFRLVTEFRANDFVLANDLVEYVNTIVTENGSSSLVMPFFVGLLRDKAADFFAQMAPFASLYSSQEILVWNMMFELSEISEESVKKMKNFLPSEVHKSTVSTLAPFYSSSSHEQLLRLGIECGRIKFIHDVPYSNLKLPLNTTIPVFEINLDEQKLLPEELQNANVQTLLAKSENASSEEEAQTVFNFLTSIASVEKRALILKNVGNFNNTQLENMDYLSCQFKDEDALGVDKIISTLQNETKIEKLKLVMDDSSNLENMKNIFNHISHLKVLHLENNSKENCEFDLQSFAPSDETSKYLTLRNVKLLPTSQKWNLHYLDTDDSNPETAATITSVSLEVLSCTARLLYSLHKIEPREWPGYQSLREIVLKVDDSALKPQVWHNLASFPNLHTFAVYLQTKSNKQYWGIDEIQESILSLPISKFIIWAVEYNVQSVTLFCNKVKEYMLEKNTCNFQHITFFIGNASEDDLDQLRPGFADLLLCVKSEKLKSFSICCDDLSIWPLIVRQQVLDTSIFSIEHDICGSRDDDSFTSKFYLKECLIVCNRFRISLKT